MTELAAHRGVHSPLQIDYSRGAMERIRSHVMAGLGSDPAKRTAAGGLLLGERAGSRVRVFESVELRCSHAFGPAFQLTPEELRRGREWVLGSGALPVIGWYFSKLDGEPDLNRIELDIFRQLFPAEWQVTLVLVPRTSGSLRAAFFYRNPAGCFAKVGEEVIEARIPESPFNTTVSLRPGGKLSWVLTAILALAAGAAIFLIQNNGVSHPVPPQPPAAQIP